MGDLSKEEITFPLPLSIPSHEVNSVQMEIIINSLLIINKNYMQLWTISKFLDHIKRQFICNLFKNDKIKKGAITQANE